MRLSTHSLQAYLAELRQGQRHLARLLEATRAVRDTAVERVMDSDTVLLRGGWKVRYIGNADLVCQGLALRLPSAPRYAPRRPLCPLGEGGAGCGEN